MKKIMVYAYTQYNLGDDLFIKLLFDRYPNSKFVLYAPGKYKEIFKRNNNVSFYSYDSLIIRGINFLFRKFNSHDFFRKFLANNCDASVQIGGSLFMQSENWEQSLKDTKYMRKKNRPFFLLGANFGPFKDIEYFNTYQEVFRKYTDICFRENYSYNLFKDLPNVRMADDIIFQLDTKNIQVKEEENIVISVIKPSLRKDLLKYDDVYFSKVSNIAIEFIENGYCVTLMSFCELEGDQEAIDEIVNLIPNKLLDKVNKFYYTGNIDESLNVIAESKLVIATRFHSMILGWLFKKPVFPIVYSKKMENVMKDVGFNGMYTDFHDIHNLLPSDVLSCMNGNIIDVSVQIKNSRGHFRKLDDYLLK
jgi:colanic acid/amylovoran biosynthesis protein